MTPIVIAVLLAIAASACGVCLLYLALPRPSWKTTGYLCASKRALRMAQTDDLVILAIEKDTNTGEERAWSKELASGTRLPLAVDVARHLIATFTRSDKE